MTWIPSAKAAKHYNRSRQYLDKLSGPKKIKRRKVSGKVEFETDSMDEYFGCNPYVQAKNESPNKKPASNPKRKTGKRPTEEEDNEETKPTGPSPLTKVDIELRQSKVVAQNLKNKIAADESVDREKTENLFFEIARAVRDSIESIAPRISGLLVGKTNHEIEQMLIEEHKRALTNLSLEI